MTWMFAQRMKAVAERTGGYLQDLLPDSLEQFTGSIKKMQIAGDRFNSNYKAQLDLAEEMIDKLGGMDVVTQRYIRENPRRNARQYLDPRMDPGWVLDSAKDLMDREPELWGDLPRDMTSFRTTWQARQAAERNDLAAMQEVGDAPWTQFAGEMVGSFDDYDVITAPLGGGPGATLKSFGRFVLTEMAIGGATEVPSVIKERAQAERLGFEAGDPVEQIGTAALFSGALAGVLGGGAKALEYLFTGRAAEKALSPDPDISLQADAAEEALRRGDDPPPPPKLRPDPALPADQDPAVLNVLELIGRVEAPKGFDQVSDFTVVAPPRPLSQMTVNEVLDWQAQNAAAGAASTASGRFQIKRSTLAGLKEAMGLTGNEPFDEALQTRMAVQLMEGRGLTEWRTGSIDDVEFANRLAQEWAALPVANGPRAGQSYYGGDGLNAAQIALGEAEAAPEAFAPRSTRAPSDVIVAIETEGKVRDEPVSDEFLTNLRTSVAPLGDDVGVTIVSGGQDPIGTPGGQRTGSTRHDVDHTGHAHTADVVLTRGGKPVTPAEDPELYARFLYEAAKVYPGIGHYDWGVHVGGGSVAAWGPDTTARSLDPTFAAAIAAGRKGTPMPPVGAGVGGDTFLGILGGERVADSFQRASAAGSNAAPGTARRANYGEIFDEISTPAGTRVPVRYDVVDAYKLRPATGDLQPRDRSRAASDEQVAKIAANLDARRLMPGPESDRNAPVIGPDGIIESGNGRVMAIKRAQEINPKGFEDYVAAIRKAGFDIPEGIRTPVLVARRTNDFTFDERVRFVRESNMSAIARMSATEQARFDADFLTQHAFDAYRPGGRINTPENAEFIRRVFAGITPEERGALINAKGQLNAEGLRRVRAALFAKAFDADDLLKLSVETENRAVANLIRLLEDLAPDWAAFRAMIDAGYVRREFDITDALMDAVRIIARARSEGRDGQSVIAAIRDRVAQADMFRDNDPLTEALIGVFYKGDRARPSEAAGEILERYAAEAAQIGRADAPQMLNEKIGPADILGNAVEGQERGTDFAPLPARTTDATEVEIDTAGFEPTLFTEGVESPGIERADEVLAEQLLRGAPERDGAIDLPAPNTVREASTFDQAREAAKEFQGRALRNTATGIEAVVSRNSLDKMLSQSAVKKSSSPALHAQAIANIDVLFEAARLGWSKPDRAGDTNIAEVQRYFVPMPKPDGRPALVKMTVKQDARQGRANPLYTIEAIEFVEGSSAVKWVDAAAAADTGTSPKAIRPAEDVQDMARQIDEFNGKELPRQQVQPEADLPAKPDLSQSSLPEFKIEGDLGQRAITLESIAADIEAEDAAIRAVTTCNLGTKT